MYWNILHLLKGTVRVRITGRSPERFLNLCSAGAISIWDLNYKDGVCICSMTLPDFFKIRAYARKAKVRAVVMEKKGLPFFMQKNRRRTMYGAGFLCFFAILFYLSLFIWDITFQGNYHYSDNTMTRFLKEQQIACGILKKQVDCEALESSIRSAFPEITWVSARISGTRLLVQIKENEVLSEIPEKQVTPCDLVADYDGVITHMIVRSGLPEVSIGDEVKKGQILVRGAVPITNDSEELIAENPVCADADIQARSCYSYRKTFPISHRVLTDTGNVRKGFLIKAGKVSVRLLVPPKPGTIWRTVIQEHQVKLFGDFCLPVWWGSITARETVSYDRTYTQIEMEEKGKEIHENFLHNLSEKGVHIIENNVKILKDASLCHVEGTVLGEGTIGCLQPVSLYEADEMDKALQHSGQESKGVMDIS